jgi:hypothetical protein
MTPPTRVNTVQETVQLELRVSSIPHVLYDPSNQMNNVQETVQWEDAGHRLSRMSSMTPPIRMNTVQETVQLGAAGHHLEHGRGGPGGRRLLQWGKDERHLREGVR